MMTRREMAAMAGAATLVGVAGRAQAQAPVTLASGDPWPPRETIPLWPNGLPGGDANRPAFNPSINGGEGDRQLWLRGVSEPAIHIYRPETPNGMGVLAIPGGGYDFVSFENEGANIARRLNAAGYTVAVLTYRLPAEGWAAGPDVVLQDAQRALRLFRHGAERFGISPDRVSLVGFSAGGHLGAMLAVAHDRPVYDAVDAADAVSARPDTAALIYPLVSFAPEYSRSNSGSKLLGEAPSPELLAAWSPLEMIDAETPPGFLVHSLDDGLVMSSNPIGWAERLRDAGVPVELHLFDQGGHGYGPASRPGHPAGPWMDLYDAWLRRRFAV